MKLDPQYVFWFFCSLKISKIIEFVPKKNLMKYLT